MPVHRALAGLAFALCSALTSGAQAAGAEAGAGPIDLTFASFFRRPVGPRGLELSDALRAADGRQVRLAGYIVAQEEPAPGRFLFAPYPIKLSEHADGAASDLPASTVTVLLHESQRTRIVPHQGGVLVLSGRLQVGRDEDAEGRVSWLRLQLAPEALEQAAPQRRAAATPESPTPAAQ